MDSSTDALTMTGLKDEKAPEEQRAVWLADEYSKVGKPPRRGSALTTDDWVWLNPEDRVKVQLDSEVVAAGFVDIVAPDASIFWIWLDGGRGRVALHMDDHVSVWLEEEQG